jgi:hypothetical protein
VSRHSLGLIVTSIVVGFVCRVIQFRINPASVGIGDRPSAIACDSAILFVPLAFAAGLARPFGVRRELPYPLSFQITAAAWICWAVIALLGIALILAKPGFAMSGQGEVGAGSLLVFGYRSGFWLSAGTIVVLAIESRRGIARRNVQR